MWRADIGDTGKKTREEWGKSVLQQSWAGCKRVEEWESGGRGRWPQESSVLVQESPRQIVEACGGMVVVIAAFSAAMENNRSRPRTEQAERENEEGGKSLWIVSEKVVLKGSVKWLCRDIACWVL